MDKIGAAMLSLPGKVFVIVITGALFGFNLYGAIMLKLSFDQNRFLPPDSMSYKYKFTNSKVASQSKIKLSTHFLSLHFSFFSSVSRYLGKPQLSRLQISVS